jgi:hypothetical protein
MLMPFLIVTIAVTIPKAIQTALNPLRDRCPRVDDPTLEF